MKRKIKCWEFFECNEQECPVYKAKELRCWLIPGTHCRNEIQGKFLEKMEMCLHCEPFRANMDLDSMEATLRVVNRQFTQFRRMVEDRDRELEGISMELALGLSEVFEALKEISSGDPLVRIPETSELELITKLKHMVNLTAKELAEIVDLSHEFAMGLAEHFDVLHRVSKGDLNARVSGTSQVELLEALKEVTNQMIRSVSREIIEHERAEEALRQSESKYRTLLENLPQKIFHKDRYSVYVSCNENYALDLKVKPQEIKGMTDYEFFSKELAEKYREDDRRVIASGKTQDIEEKYIQDGQEAWVHTVKTPIRDEQGNITGVLAIFWDVTARKRAEATLQRAHDELEIRVEERTAELSMANVLLKQEIAERKHAEEALQESEERYRTLFEQSRDAIYMTDRGGRFVHLNQSFLDLFGYTRQEMIGLDIKKMCVYPDVRCRFEQEIEQRGSVRDFEAKFRKKNGTEMDCLLTATLRRANDGSVIGNEGIIRDMTERKRLQAQLQQAQKMDALGRLAAGVAHEINNPLTIILTSAMLIQEDTDRDDPNFEGLETITNETVRCRNIVSSLLDFARQTTSAKGEHRINDVVIESMRLTQKKAAFKDLAVTHDLSEDIPIISIDRNQILQCLVNLAINAIEATDPGGRITVATRFLRLDEAVEIAIIDTGNGIAEDKMDKIFDPFFTTKEGGTGLGLAITRGIIEQHGGTIDVKSEPGHGTTVTIRFPISKIRNDTRAK